MKPQPVKRLIVLIGLLALVGGIVLSCGGLENQPLEPVEAKTIKKAEPLKTVKVPGKYVPKVRMNSTHIEVTGAYCTCGRQKWKKNNKKVIFEKDIRFTKNNKKIPKGKYFKILFNSKGVPDGEFTVRNKGTRYNDMDLCMFCGREKSQRGKSVNQFYMKKLA